MFIGSNIHIGTLCLRGVAVAGASYLLDTYPAFAAYSTRLLSGSYAGSCMRVRRASDNAEADIGFSSGWVDESAIATHCGASNGFVSKWYDQSGNGYDATQATTTNQGQIYNGSAVIKENGKPVLRDQGSQTMSYVSSTLATVTIPTTFFVLGKIGANATEYLCGGSNRFTNAHSVYWNTSFSGRWIADAGVVIASINGYTPNASNTQQQVTCMFGSSSSVGRQNGSQFATGGAGTEVPTTLALGSREDGTLSCNGIQEYVFYNSDQSANFSAIETDINTAFSVY